MPFIQDERTVGAINNIQIFREAPPSVFGWRRFDGYDYTESQCRLIIDTLYSPRLEFYIQRLPNDRFVLYTRETRWTQQESASPTEPTVLTEILGVSVHVTAPNMSDRWIVSHSSLNVQLLSEEIQGLLVNHTPDNIYVHRYRGGSGYRYTVWYRGGRIPVRTPNSFGQFMTVTLYDGPPTHGEQWRKLNDGCMNGPSLEILINQILRNTHPRDLYIERISADGQYSQYNLYQRRTADSSPDNISGIPIRDNLPPSGWAERGVAFAITEASNRIGQLLRETMAENIYVYRYRTMVLDNPNQTVHRYAVYTRNAAVAADSSPDYMMGVQINDNVPRHGEWSMRGTNLYASQVSERIGHFRQYMWAENIYLYRYRYLDVNNPERTNYRYSLYTRNAAMTEDELSVETSVPSVGTYRGVNIQEVTPSERSGWIRTEGNLRSSEMGRRIQEILVHHSASNVLIYRTQIEGQGLFFSIYLRALSQQRETVIAEDAKEWSETFVIP